MSRMRGTMLWFNEDKDHGYISTVEGERLYVAGTGFTDGGPPKGRCAGLPVEFLIVDSGEAREAGECALVEDAAPARARRRYTSRTR
jgi:cold shock CspA family protein